MDADRQVEKHLLSEAQKKALADKLRAHEDIKMEPIPEPQPEYFPPPKKKRITSI